MLPIWFVPWAASAFLFWSDSARAEPAAAPDVVVFCEPTLQPALAAIAADWRHRSGVPVRLFPGPIALLLEQVARHPRSDLVVGVDETRALAAEARGLIKPGTRRMLWRGHLVVAAVKGGAEAPANDLAAAAGKVKIALVDPWAASASADTKAALDALGLRQSLESSSVGVADTADAVFLLHDRSVRLALVYATDVAADPALAVAQALPETLYPPIVYWVAETTDAVSPNTEAFETALTQAGDRARAAGLEQLP